MIYSHLPYPWYAPKKITGFCLFCLFFSSGKGGRNFGNLSKEIPFDGFFRASRPQGEFQRDRYCWWFRNPASSPVDTAGSLSHDLRRVCSHHPNGGVFSPDFERTINSITQRNQTLFTGRMKVTPSFIRGSLKCATRLPGFIIWHQPKEFTIWWLKSCTTWDVWNPINNGKNYLSTGAGFQPSTALTGKSSNYHTFAVFDPTPNR